MPSRFDKREQDPRKLVYVCPVCGRVMTEIWHSQYEGYKDGTDEKQRFVCQKAIGEIAFDPVQRRQFYPFGSLHRELVYWRADSIKDMGLRFTLGEYTEKVLTGEITVKERTPARDWQIEDALLALMPNSRQTD